MARIYILLLLIFSFQSCNFTKCDYKESDIVLFDNPDSLGISFKAHKDYKPYIYANEGALEKDIGELIEYGTETGKDLETFINKLDIFQNQFSSAELERLDEGKRGGFDYYIYRSWTSAKKYKEQLSIYLGNDTIISSVIVTFSKADGGCYDEALNILNSVELDPSGYKPRFKFGN